MNTSLVALLLYFAVLSFFRKNIADFTGLSIRGTTVSSYLTLSTRWFAWLKLVHRKHGKQFLRLSITEKEVTPLKFHLSLQYNGLCGFILLFGSVL